MKVYRQRNSMADTDLVSFVHDFIHDGEAEWLNVKTARRLAYEILEICDAIEADEPGGETDK